MYIRRKVFSKLQTEDGQERYFSTTEFTYMSEAEQREFSKKDESKDDDKEDEKKIRWSDKQNIKRLKKMYKKDEDLKNAHLEQYDDDPEVRKEGNKKVMKKGLKRGLATTGIVTAAGAGIGYGMGKASGLSNRESLKQAGTIGGMAALGGAAGTIGGVAGAGLANKIKDKRIAKGKDGEKKTKDQVMVAAGKMSEEEYTKKWGKKKH